MFFLNLYVLFRARFVLVFFDFLVFLYVSDGWLRVGGIAIFIGTVAAPAPGAPGGGGCPPLLYTVASGSPGFGGPINITFCLLSTFKNAFC